MRTIRIVAVTVTALVLARCGAVQRTSASDAVLRPAEDAPARFTTVEGSLPEDGCRTTLVDPRDQSTLRLARSAQYGMRYRGDYEADGRYGVRPGELLRIDCTTGEVFGIVRI